MQQAFGFGWRYGICEASFGQVYRKETTVRKQFVRMAAVMIALGMGQSCSHPIVAKAAIYDPWYNPYEFPDSPSDLYDSDYDQNDEEEYEDEEEDSGWKKVGKKWFYYDSRNRRLKGWFKDSKGSIYYLDKKTGARTVGLATIEDGVFYFGKNGKLNTGWVTLGDAKYFFSDGSGFGKKGRAVTGFKMIDGKRYHFQDAGMMDTGQVQIGNDVYFFGDDGAQKVGWITVEDNYKRYYFTHSDKGMKYGQMAKNMTYLDHFFSESGLTSPTMDYCKNVLDQVGWNLRAAYNWSAGLSYSGRTTYLESWGSDRLAKQGFEHHTGNCYVMAATFYELAICMGYDAHQIAGAVPSRRGGLTNHSWVEIVEDGSVWVYDPNCTMETGADRFHIRYGTPGTWRYSSYHRMN